MSIVKLSNNGVKNATALGSISSLGSMTFIKKLTASSSSTLSFVDGASSVVLDDTYKEYLFTFNNIHGSASASLNFKASTDTGSSYGVATTTTAFMAEQGESSDPSLGYRTSEDHAQDTGAIKLSESFGVDNDQSASGYLQLFAPSSTTFVKHFIGRFHSCHAADYADDAFKAGYVNSTSAVDAIQFSMSSGNIDAGDICLYGIA